MGGFPCAIVAGDTARPSAQDLFAFQLIPGKMIVRLAGHQEITGALGQLGEVDGIILRTAGIGVDTGFGSHEADVSIPADKGSHYLVSPGSVD